MKTFAVNGYYLGLIQNLYAGAESESVAMLQFLYNGFSLENYNEELANFFYSLAEKEQKHQKILANIIVKMGADPIFCSAQGKWLGGRSVDYVKNVKQMLELALELKEKMIIDYKTTITKIDNKEIINILENIVKEEIFEKNLIVGIKKNYFE